LAMPASALFQRKRRPPMRLGITPLIDIVFLLLIFFMLTSRFIAHEGLEVDLPRTVEPHELKAADSHVIILLEEGKIMYLGQITSLDQFRRFAGAMSSEALASPFEIRSSRRASVQTMVSVLELLREAGASRVRIGTVYEPSETGAMTDPRGVKNR